MLTSEELETIRGRAEAKMPDLVSDAVVQLIAHARTDVPALLDEVERQAIHITELQQLMAQGHSKARKHGLQRDALSRELYRTQMILEGVSADYGDSPMAIQARPPVDDVSGLLDERLKRDAARIAELETAQQPRPMADAPRDGEFWGIVPLKHCEHASEEWGQPTYIDRDDGLWASPSDDDMFVGWLPLPDQTEANGD